jgi:MFS family permease
MPMMIAARSVLILVSIVFHSGSADLSDSVRTVQGLGGGGILSSTDIILSDIVPLRERGAYYGSTWSRLPFPHPSIYFPGQEC